MVHYSSILSLWQQKKPWVKEPCVFRKAAIFFLDTLCSFSMLLLSKTMLNPQCGTTCFVTQFSTPTPKIVVYLMSREDSLKSITQRNTRKSNNKTGGHTTPEALPKIWCRIGVCSWLELTFKWHADSLQAINSSLFALFLIFGTMFLENSLRVEIFTLLITPNNTARLSKQE